MIAGDSFSYKDNSKLFQKISSYASLAQYFLDFNFNKIFPEGVIIYRQGISGGQKII